MMIHRVNLIPSHDALGTKRQRGKKVLYPMMQLDQKRQGWEGLPSLDAVGPEEARVRGSSIP